MDNLYNELVSAYKKLKSPVEIKHSTAQEYVTNYWSSVKNEKNARELAKLKLEEWKRQALKRNGSLFSYCRSLGKKKGKEVEKFGSSSSEGDLQILTSQSTVQLIPLPIFPPAPSPPPTRRPRKKICYAEVELDGKILVLSEEVNKLDSVVNLNKTSNNDKTHKIVQEKKTELDGLIKRRRKLLINRKNQKKVRERKKMTQNNTIPTNHCDNWNTAISESVENMQQVGPGKPKCYDKDTLIKAITDIALAGSATDSQRCTEVINSCKTLDDLTMKLSDLGSVYLRLLPRQKDSNEGEQDKKVANIKVCRAQPMKHAKNSDRWFASAIMHHIEDFAVLMGEENVAILGKYDKALIPLGMPAATKESPILMSMEYPVTLPDHFFVDASKHKLIPSIYTAREIKESGLSRSGPTHAAIRSLKHDKPAAFAGFDDLNFIITSQNFEPFLKHGGSLKPIWIFTRDGHDGPRFPTTRKALTKFFEDNDVDYIIAVCDASGLSAYHFIESRMRPLSKELAGVVLPHDTFGSHLDPNGTSIDERKELQHFQRAGKLLADIWSSTTIDGYPVSAEWVDPDERCNEFQSFSDKTLGGKWMENHVRISKYCLEIAKCGNSDCCRPLRTNVQTVLQGQFLPTPLVFAKGGTLMNPQDKNENNKCAGFYKCLALRHMRPSSYEDCEFLPFDLYCPSTPIDTTDYLYPYNKCGKNVYNKGSSADSFEGRCTSFAW